MGKQAAISGRIWPRFFGGYLMVMVMEAGAMSGCFLRAAVMVTVPSDLKVTLPFLTVAMLLSSVVHYREGLEMRLLSSS